MLNLHDEDLDVIFLIVIIFIVIISTTLVIAYNIQPNMLNVSTFITEKIKYYQK